jgi:predicted nucleic-acid-binding protein
MLTGDDPAQTRRAQDLFDRETVFIAKTVLLETEWVLRYMYGRSPDSIIAALSHLVALANVRCEDTTAVAEALQWSARGIDFADALHCASAREATEFVTFDRKLANRARTVVPLKVVAP